MVLGQHLSMHFFLVAGLIVGCMNYAQAAQPLPDRLGVFGGNPYFGYGANPPKGMQDLMAADNINNLIDAAERQIDIIRKTPDSPAKNDKIQILLSETNVQYWPDCRLSNCPFQ